MVAAVGVEQPGPHRHAQQRIAAAVSAVPICAAEVPAAATVWLPHVVDVYEPLPGQACLTASAVLAHQHRVDVHAFAQLRLAQQHGPGAVRPQRHFSIGRNVHHPAVLVPHAVDALRQKILCCKVRGLLHRHAARIPSAAAARRIVLRYTSSIYRARALHPGLAVRVPSISASSLRA